MTRCSNSSSAIQRKGYNYKVANFSAIILDFCFFAIITLKRSKSPSDFLVFLFASFLAHAVLFQLSRVLCSCYI